MENLNGNMNVSENDKQILKSVAPLVVVIILFFVAGKFAISQVKSLRDQISEAKKTQSVLSNKNIVLRTISQVSEAGSSAALIALPKSNPSLQVVSQLKSLASANAVVMDTVKSSAPVDTSGDLVYVTTSFNLKGPRDSILSFVKSVENLAPITYIEKIGLSEDGGSIEAVISVKTYFAPLPKTIPTITQPITDLTSTEKSLLSEITGLTQPAFTEVTFATSGAINANPFGQ